MHNLQRDHRAHRATATRHPICFLAHDIDVPMNVGSFFRIADALGVERIFLTGRSCVPPSAKISKTSRSTEKHVPCTCRHDPLQVVAELRQAGYRIVSLEITSASMDLEQLAVNPGDRVCLILGSENTGVCQALLDASDATVHIPMLGHNSSMNVASACAIATYAITRKMG